MADDLLMIWNFLPGEDETSPLQPKQPGIAAVAAWTAAQTDGRQQRLLQPAGFPCRRW